MVSLLLLIATPSLIAAGLVIVVVTVAEVITRIQGKRGP